MAITDTVWRRNSSVGLFVTGCLIERHRSSSIGLSITWMKGRRNSSAHLSIAGLCRLRNSWVGLSDTFVIDRWRQNSSIGVSMILLVERMGAEIHWSMRVRVGVKKGLKGAETLTLSLTLILIQTLIITSPGIKTPTGAEIHRWVCPSQA
jgi:hypothetical protein